MGTHRSRHNKGRKPMYKHFERDSVRTWDFEEKPLREKIVPIVRNNYASPKTKKTIQLIDEVRAFIEARKERDALAKAETAHLAENAFHLIVGNHETDNKEVVAASARDVLLQLFMERKISGGHMYAGRRWQDIMERATLQPNMSIDWSQRVSLMPYQARGTVTDGQWSAMKTRRRFHDEHGPSLLGLLDFCLQPDRRRADLIRAFNTNDDELVKLFENLLGKAAGALDLTIGGARRGFFWRSAA